MGLGSPTDSIFALPGVGVCAERDSEIGELPDKWQRICCGNAIDEDGSCPQFDSRLSSVPYLRRGQQG